MSVQKTIGPPINIVLTRSNESSCIVILSSNQHNLGENLFFAPISLFSAEEIAHKLRYRLRLPQQRRLRAKLFHHRGRQSHEPRGRLYYCSEGATQWIGLADQENFYNSLLPGPNKIPVLPQSVSHINYGSVVIPGPERRLRFQRSRYSGNTAENNSKCIDTCICVGDLASTSIG